MIEFSHPDLRGYQFLGAFKANDTLRPGDRLRSPCSDGLIIEVIEELKDAKGKPSKLVKVREVGKGENAPVFVWATGGSRNDFPSYLWFRSSLS